MHDYFRARYSPTNIVLAAAGNIDFAQLVRDAETFCGPWQAFAAPRELPPATGNVDFHQERRDQATQQYVVQLGAAPDTFAQTRYANRLLTMIVGDDTSSRLYWELVDNGRAEFAGIGAYEYQGAGINMTFMCCDPDDTPENLDALTRIVRGVEREGITDDELELAKNKICSHLVLRAERPSQRMFSIGNGWLQRRRIQDDRRSGRRLPARYASTGHGSAGTVSAVTACYVHGWPTSRLPMAQGLIGRRSPELSNRLRTGPSDGTIAVCS